MTTTLYQVSRLSLDLDMPAISAVGVSSAMVLAVGCQIFGHGTRQEVF